MSQEGNLKALLYEKSNEKEEIVDSTDDLPENISFFRFGWVLFKKSVPIGIMRMLQFLLNLVNFYFISSYDDKDLVAGYGLTCSIQCFFFAVLVGNVSEVAGIYHSKHYGAKRYYKMYISFLRGFGITFVL